MSLSRISITDYGYDDDDEINPFDDDDDDEDNFRMFSLCGFCLCLFFDLYFTADYVNAEVTFLPACAFIAPSMSCLED